MTNTIKDKKPHQLVNIIMLVMINQKYQKDGLHH